jgi:hypothetical protein
LSNVLLSHGTTTTMSGSSCLKMFVVGLVITLVSGVQAQSCSAFTKSSSTNYPAFTAVSNASHTFNQCASVCRSLHPNASLVQFNDSDTQENFMHDTIYSGTFWIGLRQANESAGPTSNWFWTNGEPMRSRQWCTNEPNNLGVNKTAGASCAYSDSKKCWADDFCTNSYRCGCEVDRKFSVSKSSLNSLNS